MGFEKLDLVFQKTSTWSPWCGALKHCLVSH